MPDTTNSIEFCGAEIQNTTLFPDTVLQTLDRRVGKDHLFFAKELFAQSVMDWAGIPVIFQPEGIHPKDFKAVAENPVTAAKAVGGRLVGSVSNPRIVIPGGPRLMAELDIDEDDREIRDLWESGKIFPSTAFTAESDGDRLVSPPVPNHVLLFPAKPDVVVPGDPGAFVNTYEVTTTMTTKEDDETKTCTADVPETAGDNEGNAGNSAELVQMIADLRAELDALKTAVAELKQMPVSNAEPDPLKEIDPEAPVNELRTIAELSAENNALKAEIEALKKELEDQKAAADRTAAELNTMLADAKFSRILDKIPVGAKATEDQVNTMRKAFDAGDIETILNTVLAPATRSGATAQEGVPFTQSKTISEKPTGVGDLSRPRKGERA